MTTILSASPPELTITIKTTPAATIAQSASPPESATTPTSTTATATTTTTTAATTTTTTAVTTTPTTTARTTTTTTTATTTTTTARTPTTRTKAATTTTTRTTTDTTTTRTPTPTTAAESSSGLSESATTTTITTAATTTTTTTAETAPSTSPSTGPSEDVNGNNNITIGGVALPIVVGVAAGGGGLLIIVIIIVVVCIKRRRRSLRRSLITSSGKWFREDFEERVNSLYVSSYDFHATQTEATATDIRLPMTTFTKSTNNPHNNEEEEELDSQGYVRISKSMRKPDVRQDDRKQTVSHDSSLYTSIDSAGYSLPSENTLPQGQVVVVSDEGLYSSADGNDDGGRNDSLGIGKNSKVKLDPEYSEVSDALTSFGKNAAQSTAEILHNNPVQTETGPRYDVGNIQGAKKTGLNLTPDRRPTVALKPSGVKAKPSDIAHPASRGTRSFNGGYEDVDLEKEVTQTPEADAEYNFLNFSQKASQAVAHNEDSNPLYSHLGKT